MSRVTLWCEAMWGIFRRDALLFVSYRSQMIAQFLGPLFSITLFYYISHILTDKTIHSPGGYFGFVIVGLVIVQILTVSIGVMPVTMRQELVSGTIERFLVSAHGPINGILGTMLFPLTNALVSGALMLALAAVIFGLPLAATALLAIPVVMLGTLAFMPFAFVLVALVMAFKQAASATQFIIAGIAIVGGLYFPTTVLPEWIRWTSDVQPFTPATDLLRHLLVGAPLVHPAAIELLKLAGFVAVLLPAGVALLRVSIRYGQRTGTVAEY
ncbi:MAG TPA: ABC transporter permease [Solirubrobacteraceae bacterium]|jgi:ABC-2 type transport system permease protein|nr:ABC transporter permease [Solirubrobacteraceae bacterium]